MLIHSILSMNDKINVSIVEDDKVTRNYYVSVLRQAQGINFQNEFSSAEELLADNRTLTGVLLVDVGLPGINGIEMVEMLKGRGHFFYPLFISASIKGSLISRAILAGGCGFLVKPIDDKTLIFSIHDVVHGGCPMSKKTMQVFIENLRSKKVSEPKKCSIEDSRSLLTTMEDVVFKLLIEGSSSKEIANMVSVSLATVNTHIQHIFKKFKVASRPQLMALILNKCGPCRSSDRHD